MATTPTPLGASKSLRANCFKALKEELKTKFELQSLRSKIRQLQDHEESLNDKISVDAWETANVLLAFAKHDCLELCNKVYKAFPREVRDIIYGYIIGCGEVDICSENHRAPHKCGYRSLNSENQHRLCSSGVDTDHWWKDDFVGAKMVREIGEHYYRESHFHFKEAFSELAKFRATDQFNLGFLPVHFISKVEIVVDCRKYKFWPISSAKDDAFLDEHQKQLRSKRNRCAWRGQKTQEDLFVELEYLFGFRPGTGITVRLMRTYHKIQATRLEDQEWMCHRVVPVIFPVLQRIKDTNCRARLILGMETDSGPDEDGYMPFASKWNPTSIEAITADFWEHVETEHERAVQAELESESDGDDGPWDNTGGGWIVSQWNVPSAWANQTA
ncbi:unnamed protein product [Alternaria alternata]